MRMTTLTTILNTTLNTTIPLKTRQTVNRMSTASTKEQERWDRLSTLPWNFIRLAKRYIPRNHEGGYLSRFDLFDLLAPNEAGICSTEAETGSSIGISQ
jgi:hypothetical protein